MIGWAVASGTLFGLVLLALGPAPAGVHARRRRGRPRAGDVAAVRGDDALNGAVFALDGILIGAGDTRYIVKAMVASAPVGIVVALRGALGMGDRRRVGRSAT